MGFSLCLSRKRPSHGLGGSARDGLYPLPVKEKAVSWSWCALAGGFPRGPGRPPEVPGELSRPKNTFVVKKCSTKVVVFGTPPRLGNSPRAQRLSGAPIPITGITGPITNHRAPARPPWLPNHRAARGGDWDGNQGRNYKDTLNLGPSWVPAGHGRASPAPNAATDVSRIYQKQC